MPPSPGGGGNGNTPPSPPPSPNPPRSDAVEPARSPVRGGIPPGPTAPEPSLAPSRSPRDELPAPSAPDPVTPGTFMTGGLRPPSGQSIHPDNHSNSVTPKGKTKTQQKNHRKNGHKVGPTDQEGPNPVPCCSTKCSGFFSQSRRGKTPSENPAQDAERHKGERTQTPGSQGAKRTRTPELTQTQR